MTVFVVDSEGEWKELIEKYLKTRGKDKSLIVRLNILLSAKKTLKCELYIGDIKKNPNLH